MKIVYLSRREKAARMLREGVQALRSRLANSSQSVEPRQERVIATRKIRALGLTLNGPAAVYTRMFQCAIEEACQAAPGGALPIQELPQRVDYDLLREVGVSDEEVAGLHERLTRRCSLRIPLFSGRLKHRLAAL